MDYVKEALARARRKKEKVLSILKAHLTLPVPPFGEVKRVTGEIQRLEEK